MAKCEECGGTMCPYCGDCTDCGDCDCDEIEAPSGAFDPDELGLDPEDDVEFYRRRSG